MGTLVIVSVLNRDEFDAIEFDAACTGDHQAAAERMSVLARTGTSTPSLSRAEAFVQAGEQWLLAGEPAAAVADLELALADGGPAEADPRVPMCRALFQMDREPQARAMIEELKPQGKNDARTCDLMMELLLEQLDLPGALEWATAGVELILHDATGSRAELLDLLRIRYRIRNDLRLPEDEYDRMLST